MSGREIGNPGPKWLAWGVWFGLCAADSAAVAETSSPAGPLPTSHDASQARRAAEHSPLHSPPQLPAEVFAVPRVRQALPYSCGAAALSAILRYLLAWDGTESKLYLPLGTSASDGTLPEKLTEVARSFGLRAQMKQQMTIDHLRAALRAGQVVILELQAWPSGAPPQSWSDWWADGHYVVLMGMDADYAYFMDPAVGDQGYAYLELRGLLPRWHDINEVRPDPRRQRDYQLGVVIGPSPQTAKAVPAKGELLGPAGRLLKME